MNDAAHARQVNRGVWIGMLGIVIFSATLPLTKLAVGSHDAPQLSLWFVTFGRAAVAGVLSVLYLLVQRLRGTGQFPVRSQWGLLGFVVLRSVDMQGQLSLHLADFFLLLAMLSAALGYVGGARLTPSLGSEREICWVLVISLPFTLPLAFASLPPDINAIRQASWWAFAYVAVFSMWLGFFAWYRGLVLGGAARVSQVQLVQPFLSMVLPCRCWAKRWMALPLVLVWR